MKTQNLVRNLSIIALLAGGIVVVGAENQSFAQDRSGFINGGGRSGYISASGGTGSAATASAADTTRSGYIVAGGRAEDSGLLGSGGEREENTIATVQVSEEGSESWLQFIWNFFV